MKTCIKCQKTEENIKFIERENRCRNCSIKYHHEYYLGNKEKKWKYSRQHYQENIERERARRVKHYWKHRDVILEKQRVTQKTQNYRYLTLIQTAKRKKLELGVTKEDHHHITRKPCHYCNSKNETFGLDRVNSSLGYLEENVVSCCATCNFMKLQMTKENFLTHIEKIYKHNF